MIDLRMLDENVGSENARVSFAARSTIGYLTSQYQTVSGIDMQCIPVKLLHEAEGHVITVSFGKIS